MRSNFYFLLNVCSLVHPEYKIGNFSYLFSYDKTNEAILAQISGIYFLYCEVKAPYTGCINLLGFHFLCVAE